MTAAGAFGPAGIGALPLFGNGESERRAANANGILTGTAGAGCTDGCGAVVCSSFVVDGAISRSAVNSSEMRGIGNGASGGAGNGEEGCFVATRFCVSGPPDASSGAAGGGLLNDNGSVSTGGGGTGGAVHVSQGICFAFEAAGRFAMCNGGVAGVRAVSVRGPASFVGAACTGAASGSAAVSNASKSGNAADGAPGNASFVATAGALGRRAGMAATALIKAVAAPKAAVANSTS